MAGRKHVSSTSTTKQIEFEILAEPAPGNPFHLAIPVHCMNAARNFYGDVLGLKVLFTSAMAGARYG